jgi:hypothetical protein
MSPIFGSFGSGSIRGFGRITKGFSYSTEVLLTTPGAGNWTKPDGVTLIQVECWGGGGAGGGCSTNNTGGASGAGGQYAKKIIVYGSAQQSIAYSVAASVAGTNGNGANGNDTTWQTNVVVAKGGPGGLANRTDDVETAGSITGGIGDIVFRGGTGGGGFFVDGLGVNPNIVGNGNGGGGAGPLRNGDDVNFFYNDNAGDFAGAGGVGLSLNSAIDNGSNGNPGNNYGGGGSGGAKFSGGGRTGGAGAQGLIRIRY